MSSRMEKWAFRVGILGLALLVAGFVYQETHDRPTERLTAASTTSLTSTTATTAPGDTSGTTGTAATVAPPTVGTDPGFVVTSPEAGATVDSSTVEFVGTGPAGEIVHQGTTTATVGDDSVWRMTLTLEPGPNTLTFTVLHSDGTPLYTTATVTYADPTATTDTTTTETTTEG